MTDPRAPVTLVVLTFNEERNLPACLENVAGWAADMVVVDSGSTDRTVALAREFGARVVEHPFETHTRQWQWALANVPLTTDWVLALDADQRLTPELRAEIAERLQQPGETVGFFLNRRQIFRGRWIRHGGYYPKYLLKLFRRASVSLDDTELVDHHFQVAGRTENLRFDMIEDNQNEASIAVWIAKHNRYATLQARQDVLHESLADPAAGESSAPASPPAHRAGGPDARTRRLKRVWGRLPLFVRPCLYVFYRYVLRLGFLDGKEGFVFHVLQGFWYRLLVDINTDELRSRAAVRNDDTAREVKLPIR
ncbi:MAG TPA: glycosyltransferase family 2 protein [Vicinamibacterales bacterium]|nr:glycosyltransferase family 2 protein [Vicinamibacterales bacterium]